MRGLVHRLFADRAETLVADVYNRTLPMSTYLLVVVVCDFTNKEKVADNGVKVRQLYSDIRMI